MKKIEESPNQAKWILIPEFIQAGSFQTLKLKLVKFPTWQVIQSHEIYARSNQGFQVQEIGNLLHQIGKIQDQAKSDSEAIYLSSQSKETSTFASLIKFWPTLLMLPIFLLYL